MRAVVAFTGALLALAVPASGAPMEAPDKWMVWSDDGRDDPVDVAPGDIDQIRVGTTAGHLHLQLTTFPSSIPPVLPTSRLDFVPTGSNHVRFFWGGAESRLFIGSEEKTGGWEVADGSGPLGWHVRIPWGLLGIDQTRSFWLESMDAATSTYAPRDTAIGPNLFFAPTGAGVPQVADAPALSWRSGMTIEGPDYAGGASVAIGSYGQALVAYYVYDESRGTERGIYLAQVRQGALVPERIADTAITRDGGRDDQMRTKVAHDGKDTFVLFTDHPATDNDEDGPGDPGTPDSVFVLAQSNGRWRREDPTPAGASDVGPEDVSDLVARDGRLVAAVPVGDHVWVVERTGPAQWQVLHRIAGATNAKLALDSKGGIHVAYAVYDSASGSWRDGKLYYASSATGYDPLHIGDNIDSGWEEPGTDGSYAIAVGPGDQVALLWNDGRSQSRNEEQRVAIRKGGNWKYDFAPLVPVHGNPQYTMRLGFTADGTLVAASGYGGSDMLAARSAGGWASTELGSYEVWDMAVAPSGTAWFAYTQPHGGTTLAVTAFGLMAGEDVVASEWMNGMGPGIPALSPLVVVLALLGLALRRR